MSDLKEYLPKSNSHMLYSFIVESDNFYVWIGKLALIVLILMIAGYFFIRALVKIVKR